MPKSKPPLIVVVKDGHYYMFGSNTPPLNYRTRFLAALLKRQGGVNESVPDGTYHYNIKRWRLNGLEVTLLPATAE